MTMHRAKFNAATDEHPDGEPTQTEGWLFLIKFAGGRLHRAIVHRHHDDQAKGAWTVSDPKTGRRMCRYLPTRREAMRAAERKFMFPRPGRPA